MQTHEPGIWTSIKDYLRINWQRFKHQVKADFANLDYDAYIEKRMNMMNVRKGWTDVPNIYDVEIRPVPTFRISNYMKVHITNKKKYVKNLFYNNYGPTVAPVRRQELMIEDYSEETEEKGELVATEETETCDTDSCESDSSASVESSDGSGDESEVDNQKTVRFDDQHHGRKNENIAVNIQKSDLPAREEITVDPDNAGNVDLGESTVEVSDKVLDQILSGDKNVEVRRHDGRFRSLGVHGLIKFVAKSGRSLIRTIKSYQTYDNINHLLAVENYKQISPDTQNILECKKKYDKYDQDPVVAFHISTVSPVAVWYDKIFRFVVKNKEQLLVNPDESGRVIHLEEREEDKESSHLRDYVVNSVPTLNNPHYKIVFNPSGKDMKCGMNALLYFRPNLIVPRKAMFQNLMVDIPKNGWEIQHMLAVANVNNIHLYMHSFVNGKMFIEEYGDGEPVSILLANGHYYVISCECTQRHVIGDYKDLKIDSKHLYVNCANFNCNDGAGQAAAFRKMFPNYDKNLVKPGLS